MTDDTAGRDHTSPATTEADSHPPFIPMGNDAPADAVGSDMDNEQTTPGGTPPVTMDDVNPIDGETMVSPETARTEHPPDDGAAADPQIHTTEFDYDDYYAGASAWSRPEPVSSRIEPTHEPERSPRKGPMLLAALGAGVLGALLTVGVLSATGAFDDAAAPPTTQAVAAASPAVASPAQTDTPIVEIVNDVGSAVNPAAVALKVVPSIVKVDVYEQDPTTDSGLVATGSGSGVVKSADGHIITNHHVVEGAADFTVTFEDGRTYDAELIGSDALTDLAVLEISADDLVPVEFGSTDDLQLGMPAVAVGNPLGQTGGSSVSAGIVSALNREVDFSDGSRLFGMIQTDAAINSGSSGGALVDAEGKLIGITSAIGVSQAGPEGIGYAIPVELVQRITDEIIETGDVSHPFLGVTISDYRTTASDGAEVPSGAQIESIEGTDSAAGAAGMQPGDVIVRIGDEKISSQMDLILSVRLYRVGDLVEFEVMRDDTAMTFDVTLGQRPSEFGG